jgi:phage-related protein
MVELDHLKPLEWIGSSLKDLREFPVPVRRDIGSALLLAQKGGKAESAVPLKGYGGAGVLEVIEDHRGDTYRAVYTVRFATTIYVPHTFKKKSKSGKETPKVEMDLINHRLAQAEALHRARTREKT